MHKVRLPFFAASMLTIAAAAIAAMAASESAQAQYTDPYLSSLEAQSVTSTPVTPVYVEPGQPHDPWTQPPAGDVVIFDDPTMLNPTMLESAVPSFGPPVDTMSPAQKDLGNLIPPGARKSFFQKVNFGAEWLPQFQSDGLGITTTRVNIVTALPFPKRHQPLTITPEYAVRFLEGPDFIDVPSRLHDAELKFMHIRRIADRWVFNGAVTIGAYADDRSFDAADAVRVSGRALGIYEQSETTKWIVGVVYLNRANLAVVPAIGWMYQTDDLKIDLIVPQPKIAWRTWSDGRVGYNERWFFFGGEFGGGVWAVKRASGADDNLNYGDYRVVLGTERKLVGGLSRKWEVGYVFSRELEYDSVGSDIEIDDTLFVRAGFKY